MSSNISGAGSFTAVPGTAKESILSELIDISKVFKDTINTYTKKKARVDSLIKQMQEDTDGGSADEGEVVTKMGTLLMKKKDLRRRMSPLIRRRLLLVAAYVHIAIIFVTPLENYAKKGE
jgi:hypothetical protein